MAQSTDKRDHHKQSTAAGNSTKVNESPSQSQRQQTYRTALQQYQQLRIGQGKQADAVRSKARSAAAVARRQMPQQAAIVEERV
eukprot:SAG31_NODE_17078_length_684_cov_1.126496_1_plen_83_part_01